MSGWIGVDFDGTLAEFPGPRPGMFGAPVQKMLDRVKAWLEDGREVRIVTARAADPDERLRVLDWLHAHGLPRLVVTDRKDYGMLELWDDRAIQVMTNTGERADGRDE